MCHCHCHCHCHYSLMQQIRICHLSFFFSRRRYIDKIVDVPDVLQRRVPRFQKVQKLVESTHVQLLTESCTFQLWKDSEDQVLFACHTVHSIPRYTKRNDEWHTQYTAYQDKWLSDSFLPACKDISSVRERVETEPNLSQPPLFFLRW